MGWVSAGALTPIMSTLESNHGASACNMDPAPRFFVCFLFVCLFIYSFLASAPLVLLLLLENLRTLQPYWWGNLGEPA